MFKRVCGPKSGQNVTITIKKTSAQSALYFISTPGSNIIYARRDPNVSIKLAHNHLVGTCQTAKEIVVRDDQNAWPKNYPPLR